ncbi:helix-turn-helix transcriptional regulator [Streptomyces sp. PSKA54]|uniref:Helix-turn-helix transcriptional regulator n=1 Tax=Streptomyces himalayensis subsp. aureolus TaxID=2758039 RepID=A0A7W2HKA5_9ACTN|nr:helix-turn-helix transcriptional regulator [Streptomyces himalayensis subsp. aureolus]
MDWASFGDLKDASRVGDYGRVIRRARQLAGLNQGQLAAACGLSQPAVSRLENHGTGAYNMTTLASAATALGLPFELVGLANQQANGTPPVERREFLAAAVAAASCTIAPLAGTKSDWDSSQAATLRMATTAFRRLDATIASRDLSETVQSHLRLIQTTAQNAPDAAHRARMASVGSEAASFAAWLAWDMADHGSARRRYGAAIKAAHSAGDKLLASYQAGSLASFEADAGNPLEAVRLVAQARHQLGRNVPPLAAAWLASIEAIAHATNSDRLACERALKTCEQNAIRIPEADPVAWLWIFPFDERKIASCRITCMARLGQPHHARMSAQDIATALSSGHDKQRALLTLDVAAGHLATKEIDTAFGLASQALAEGIRLRSGKVVDRARRLRRAYASTAPPSMVREFDDQLHAAYL